MVARPEIERRVGDRIVKGIGEADATITDHAKIDPVLGDVFPVSPGNVVGDVLHGVTGLHRVCCPFGSNKSETDVISRAVAGLVKASRV